MKLILTPFSLLCQLPSLYLLDTDFCHAFPYSMTILVFPIGKALVMFLSNLAGRKA